MATLTNNLIPKATAAATIQDSSLGDDATTLTYATTKFTVKAASGNTTIAGTALVTGNATIQGALNYAADAGANDTYAITLAPAPAAYTAGMYIAFKANTANTGACTIDVNSLGPKALKRGVSTDPGDNYIKAGSVVVAIYDGTNFQMIQPAAQ